MLVNEIDASGAEDQTAAADPVVYAIPLRARTSDEEWDQTQRQLTRTLASVLRQTAGDFIAVVSGHDKPALPDDPRVIWLAAHTEKPTTAALGSRDKTMKRKAILEYAAKEYPKGFYYFLLDSDDLLHNRVNSFIQETAHANGYYISSGYFFDVSTGRLALSSPKNRPFYKSCGSCAVIKFTEDTLSKASKMNQLFELTTRHATIPESAASIGFPLQEIPFAAAVYVLNHGVNLSSEQGKSATQIKHANAHAIDSDEEVRRILSYF